MRQEVQTRPRRPGIVAFDPHYRETHDRLSRELDALHADLIRQQKSGRKTFCSREIFLECRWLVYYTVDTSLSSRLRWDG